MWRKVEDYALYWAAAEKRGTVFLKLEGNEQGSIRNLGREELAALGSILRHETPIWFHTFRGDLSTEKSPGDEEDRF